MCSIIVCASFFFHIIQFNIEISLTCKENGLIWLLILKINTFVMYVCKHQQDKISFDEGNYINSLRQWQLALLKIRIHIGTNSYMSRPKKNLAFFVFYLDIWFPFQELTHFYKLRTYIYYIYMSFFSFFATFTGHAMKCISFSELPNYIQALAIDLNPPSLHP